MLPTGVLTKRAARPNGIVVSVRWFRCGENRKRVAPVHPSVPRSRYYAHPNASRHLRLQDGGRKINFVAGYCTGNGGGKKVVPFVLADIGEGISEVTVKEWYVDVGDRVAEFDNVCEVESDKATVTITSRYAGAIVKRHCEPGSLARVGSALVDIEIDQDGETVVIAEEIVTSVVEEVVQEFAVATDHVAVDHLSSHAGKVLTTPAVRRIAAEKGIDLTMVRGTGKQGRVLKEDLLDLQTSSPVATVCSTAPPSPLPSPSVAAVQDFVPLTGYTKTMRNTMEASNKIPTMVITDEVDLTRLTELKTRMLPHVKLTLLPFLLKATSLALTRHPLLNSTASADFASYRPNERHNIGVAIDTPLGLAVPNVKDVQALSVVDISHRLSELRAKAVNGKLSPADVTGGTFTLSNMGSIAGSVFRPMILPPEVAIGALGRMKYRPRYDNEDQLVRTPVMDVSWGADHRILDGATVARFFKDWKTYVENPSLILAGAKLQSHPEDGGGR